MDILQVCQLSYCNSVNGHFTGLSAVLLQLGQWTFYRFVSCLIATWSMDILQVCQLSYCNLSMDILQVWQLAYCNLVNGHFTGLTAVLLQLGQWTFYKFACCPVVTRPTAILQLCQLSFPHIWQLFCCNLVNGHLTVCKLSCCNLINCHLTVCRLSYCNLVNCYLQFVSCHIAIWSIAIWQFVTRPIATWYNSYLTSCEIVLLQAGLQTHHQLATDVIHSILVDSHFIWSTVTLQTGHQLHKTLLLN